MSREKRISVIGISIGIACLMLLGLCIWNYPASVLVSSILVVSALLLFTRYPIAIWFGLPALLPVLDFSTWTGLLLFNEYDLLLLSALGVLYLRQAFLHPLSNNWKGNHPLITALVAITLFTLLPGLVSSENSAGLTAHNYLSPWNSLRVAKGLLYAWLLWPHLYHAIRENPRTLQALAAGALFGVAFAGFEAFWEREVLLALLEGNSLYAPLNRLTDFSGEYRITGLFSTMLVGGAAIDAYLVALVPVALVCALTLRQQPQRLLAIMTAALGIYALLSTFSRASYAGLAVALLVIGVVMLIRLSSHPHPHRWLVLSTLLALTTFAGSLYFLFPYLGHRGMVGIALLGMAALVLGHLPLNRILILLCAIILWLTGALLVSEISATSRWQQEDGPLGFTSALFWVGLLLTVAGLAGWQSRGKVHWLRTIEAGAGLSLLVIALVVTAGGNRMSIRFADSLQDTLTRLQHWTTSVSLRDESLISHLLGEGPGSFPRLYYQDNIGKPDRKSLVSYEFHQNNLIAYMQLGSGDFSIAQRVNIKPDTDYTLRIQTRKRHRQTAQLGIRICPRRMLSFNRYQPECLRKRFQTDTASTWQEHEWQFNSGNLGRHAPASAPVTLLLHNGSGLAMDVSGISLTEVNNQQELVANGRFSEQSRHWYLVSDFEHLAWHSKQMLIHVWLESGWLGLLIFSGLILLALLRLYRRLLHKPEALDLALMASLSGLLVLGMFGTLLDTPRLATVFYLLVFLALQNPATGFPAHGRYLTGGLKSLAFLLLVTVTVTAIAGWKVDQYLRSHYQRSLLDALQDYHSSILLQEDALGFNYQLAHQQISKQGETPIRTQYPRILTADSYQQRFRELLDKGYKIASPCRLPKSMLNQYSCWLTSGDSAAGMTVIEKLNALKLRPVNEEGKFGNAWIMALVYDRIRHHPDWSHANDIALLERIKQGTEQYLQIMDRGGASLWHGRATLAANAWISASVLDSQNQQHRVLQQRTLAEFEGVLKALELTGGAWPESYNYWINNRAHAIALAGLAYVNTVEDTGKQEWARKILADAGHWHIHMTRPDNRIEGFGDEGPRTDLKDETQRVIDLLAAASGDPVLSDYSDYLGQLHGKHAYFRAYQWSLPLYRDPSITPSVNPDGLSAFSYRLPTARLFGRDSSNHLSMRNNWPGDDLFLNYRASDHFSHHGDYAAGHFSIYAGEPLAVNSTVYKGNVFTRNRLDYGLRSIAKNTLLIVRPGEIVHPNRFFGNNVNAGGQRITLPTGSSLQSVTEWQNNLHSGLQLDTSTVLAYDHAPGDYTLISTDLTRAYNSVLFDDNDEGGKVESVHRHLVYLRRSEQILVYDDVQTTDTEYRPKWLLHSPSQPRAGAVEVLKGQPDNGILRASTDSIDIVGESNSLHLQRLLPVDAETRLIGGEDYRYYVEVDGDDRILNGRNITNGAVNKPWFDRADWRIEVSPSGKEKHSEFLFVLTPSTSTAGDAGRLIKPSTMSSSYHRQVTVGETMIVFLHDQTRQRLELNHRGPVLITGLPASTEISLQPGTGVTRIRTSNAEGILFTELLQAGSTVLSWRSSNQETSVPDSTTP